MTSDAAVSDTGGRVRCPWGDGSDLMRTYHDQEWGRPVRDSHRLFERLTLEAFQSGLSWAIVLRKRARFRRVFVGFDPAAVARFGDAEIATLLDDPGIIRNRAKIQATIANARALEGLDRPLADLLWSFAPTQSSAPRTAGDIPSQTAESQALAKELKRRGFSFVGPTTAYALMQATGMVNDHLTSCYVRGQMG